MTAVLDPLPCAPSVEWNSAGHPFFVVGVQRSGTTMLRLMLNRHPEIAIPFETGFIAHFYHRLHEYGDLSRVDNARRLLDDICAFWQIADRGKWIKDTEGILAQPIRTYRDLVHAIFMSHARARGKSRWGDKTAGQEASLDILWKVFPECRIVHLVRDGRDVALSNRRVSWGIPNLPRAARDWRWKVTLARKIGSVLGEHYHEVKYEDLVRSPAATLSRICAFIDVRYDESMLKYHESAAREMPDVSLSWHRNSVRAPDGSLVYEWKRRMSLADRIIFDQVAGDALELMGYEREQHPSTLGSRAMNFYYANFQRW